jgi:hypothetical protein
MYLGAERRANPRERDARPESVTKPFSPSDEIGTKHIACSVAGDLRWSRQ